MDAASQNQRLTVKFSQLDNALKGVEELEALFQTV